MIEINENWAMDGNDVCLTLYKKVYYGKDHKKYGDFSWRPTAYFGAGRYDQALSHMADLSVSGLNSLDEIVEVINGLKEDIKKLDLSSCGARQAVLNKKTY